MPDTRQLTPAQKIWGRIPTQLAEKVRPLVGVLVQDAVREIQRTVPAYDQPLEGKFHEVLVGCTEMAIVTCFDYICDPWADRAGWKAAFRYGGRVEFGEGRTMDAMQAAIRVGARVVWRHLNTIGQQIGVRPEILFAIADAIFAWVDEISTTAVEGYTEAQAQATAAPDRHRRKLLELILSGPTGARRAVAELAAAANWTVPQRVAVVALEHQDGEQWPPSAALGERVLAELEGDEPCLVVGDPDDDTTGIAAMLGDRRAAVGPTVALADAHRSLVWARRALTLARSGVLPDEPVTWCAEYLTTLTLFADEFLVTQLVDRALAPFDGLVDRQRERLVATLQAWLETRGGVNDVASRLDVHPQTIRYRMHQIDELFDHRLTDPDERLIVAIGLRLHSLSAQAGRSR